MADVDLDLAALLPLIGIFDILSVVKEFVSLICLHWDCLGTS